MTPKTASKVGPTGTSYTNPLYRPPAGDGKMSPPSQNKVGLDDFDFGSSFVNGEPQPVGHDSNLGHNNSDITSKAIISFDDSQLKDSHFAETGANSSTEDAVGDAPQPAPAPVQAQSGPAQPTTQLSDDPAIAALQKAQLAIATHVAVLNECLAILNNALADPQYKGQPNGLSYLRGLFGGAIKECESMAQQVTTDTTQLLDKHVQDAKALAAQAQRGTSPVPVDTFYTKLAPVVTPVDWKQVQQEVKQLPAQVQQDQIVEGLRTALQGMGMVTVEELDQLLLDMGGETEGTRQLADDVAEIDKAFEQIVKVHEDMEVDWDQHVCAPDEANMAAIKIQVEAEENEKLAAHLAELAYERKAKVADLLRQFDENLEQEGPSAEHEGSFGAPSVETGLDPFLHDLGDASESNSRDSTGAGPERADPYADQDDLLAEAELLLEQQQKAKVAKSALKPLVLSDDVRREIEGVALRYRTHTLDLLNAEIELIKKRQLTSKELKSPNLATQATRHKTQAVITRYYQVQQHNITSADNELLAINTKEVIFDEPLSVQLKRIAELEEKRKTAMDLLDTMGHMIHKLWN